MLSVLVLFVVITLSIQIGIGTMTDARVARNDLGLAAMDDAIESALLEVSVQLQDDAAGGEEEAEPGMDMGLGGDDPTAALEAGEGQGSEAVDSKEDEWARPQRTEINGMELRIFIQDEDSKYNVLNLLHEDEELAEANTGRVARIIDLAREGTDWDIKEQDADSMAQQMREHMLQLYSSGVEEPELLSTIPDNDRRLPMTLREFLQIEDFKPHHFRDFRDRDGNIVHSLGSFLTVWSCLTDGESGGGGGASSASAAGGLGALENEIQGGGDIQGQDPSKSAGTSNPFGGDDGGLGGGAGDSDATGAGGSLGGTDSPTTGFAVNINTAPVAVLKGLFDDREISSSFWDDVIEYRNLREEPEDGAEEIEPVYDEYGNEVFQRQVFDSVEELQEIPSWGDLSTEEQELVRMYVTTTSNVFSIFVTARRSTSNRDDVFMATSAAERDREEEMAAGLRKTVRAVVWRRPGESDVELTPIIRWEVVNFSPYEIQDFPEEDR